MNKIVLILLFLGSLAFISHYELEAQKRIDDQITNDQSTVKIHTILGYVESKGNPRATNGIYVGYLQIAPVLVDDVNRICKIKKIKKKFTYADRLNKDKSVQMFDIYVGYYIRDSLTVDKVCNLWCTGNPNNYKASTKYRAKVHKRINQTQKNVVLRG